MLIKQAAPFTGFRNIMGNALNKAKGIAGNIGTTLSNTAGRVKNFGTNVAGFAGKVKNTASNIGQNIRNAGSQLKSELKQFKADADKYSTKEKFTMFFDPLKPANLANGLKGMGNSFVNGAKQLGTGLVNATGRGLQGIGNGLTGFGTRLRSFGQQ